MTTHSEHHRIADPVPRWERDLRLELVGALSPAGIAAMTAAATVGVVGTTAAAATLVVAAEGGVTMTTTIAASAAAHFALKAAAWLTAATLAAGGTAAVTGNLPDGAQQFAADAAAHIGITLPRPEASVGGSLDLEAGDVVTVDGAGRVGVRLDGDALVITGIETTAGFEASVIGQTADTITLQFNSATETATVLLTEVDGTIETRIEFDTVANAKTDTAVGTEAEAETGVGIEIGG